MLQGERNFGRKTTKKPTSNTRFLLPVEPLSLSTAAFSHQHRHHRLVHSISITRNCLTTSYSEHAAEPLSFATFLLPSPATDIDHHSLYRSLLSHRLNLLVVTKLPPQVNLLPLPFLLLLLLLRRVHVFWL